MPLATQIDTNHTIAVAYDTSRACTAVNARTLDYLFEDCSCL